ncbi:sulfurtransferase [Buchnera aphidicola (Nipponaphis monzeni)]|uniref:Sulfurtransferase n=1 Tax=Buchnera aphidicola (Nipponaphis monzeni) TaxID=2495405 RepID=A0A455TAL1_9GAMM|nr:TusE/DsrC/DsvC family sulfur relay protein [Buchnera aphidicola]BBI01355.1 sulfurtransferase [Buchnera aphidicola (Nipponaphis monzeni)]
MSSLFKYPKTDSKKYLASLNKWDLSIAKKNAKKELIIMTENHWEIVYFIRNFYSKFNQTPSMRIIAAAISKKYHKKYTSIYFLKLFPKGPMQQASKIAGIPLSNSCF